MEPKQERINRCYDSINFFQEIINDICEKSPEPIPESTMQRIEQLELLQDREIQLAIGLTEPPDKD